MDNKSQNGYVNLTIGALALLNAAIHIIFPYNLEFHRDELLYFSLGQHPAFGYATVPPMIGWIALAMQKLFGFSLFAVRFFPALLSGAMVFLISSIVKELGGSGYARILAALGIILSIFGMRTFLLFQPVHIDLMFWTLSFYLIIKFINTSSGKYLILLGIATGLALLNKYLIGILLFSFLIIVPFTRYRKIFSNKNLWYGILAGILVFSPNLIWQIANGLPVIDHFSELKRTQLVNVDQGSFLFEQLIIPGASAILTLSGILYLLLNRAANKYRFLAMVIISVIITLMLLHGKSYYAQGIFPFLIAAGSVALETLFRKTWSRILLLILIITLTLPIAPVGIPVFGKDKLVDYFRFIGTEYGMDFVCRFEDNSIHSLPQDYADMLGWEELAMLTARTWQMIPDKSTAFIYCENYGQAGAITIIGKKYDLPEAVSFHESFKYWIPDSYDKEIRSAIYINDELGDDVRALFKKIRVTGSITNRDAREYGTKVYLCEEPESGFNEFWLDRIKQIK